MAEMLIDGVKLNACLDAEADAIRAKTGGSTDIAFDYANNKGFADAIAAISSGTTITDGIVVKARDANGHQTKIDVYGDVLYRIVYQPVSYANAYDPYYLTEINLKSLPTKINKSAFVFGGGQTIPVTITGLENVTYLGMNAFYSDTGQGGAGIKPVYLEGLNFSKITSINSYCFYQTRLSGAVRLRSDCATPEQWCVSAFRETDIESIYSDASFRWNGRNFYNCKNLVSAEFTKGVIFGGEYDFNGCTALETVVLGSVGQAPSLTYSNMFSGCTQSGLTITLFAKGANVDSYLRIIRTGATNATIIIKASEATTYNGTSYAAGDTILTSEVTS